MKRDYLAEAEKWLKKNQPQLVPSGTYYSLIMDFSRHLAKSETKECGHKHRIVSSGPDHGMCEDVRCRGEGKVEWEKPRGDNPFDESAMLEIINQNLIKIGKLLEDRLP